MIWAFITATVTVLIAVAVMAGVIIALEYNLNKKDH